MEDFIANLINALALVAGALSSISFTVRNSAIKLLDVVVYSGIVSAVMSFINSASSSGAFKLNSKKSSRLANNTSKAGETFKKE